MTVSSSTNRVSYSGNGSLTTFAYSFKIFDEGDLTVILRASDGTETVQTITTHYTVTGAGSESGGNVEFVTAPTSSQTVVILRELDLNQGLDLVPNDPFPAQSLEESLDKLTFMVQQHDEELGRAIKASKTTSISTVEFTDSASDRASKIMAFDTSGDLDLTQEIGTYKGNWASGTNYGQRDIVKDTDNNNIYIANTAHTSSGSVPLSSNADIAKWDLLVDAASATTAQTAAETAQAAAETAQGAAETAQGAAETAQGAAETAQAAAETALDSFDDRYLGEKSSDPTTDNDGDALLTGALYFNTTSGMKVYDGSAWDDVKPTAAEQTNIDAVAADASDIGTVATNIANVNTVATNISGVNSFAERYRVEASDPTTSLDAGDLAFNTTASLLKYYNGTSWQSISPGIGAVSDDANPQLGGDLDGSGFTIDLSASTDAISVPSGTTAQRPTPANGMIRYSTTDNQFEGYANGEWGALGGGGGGGDTQTATTTSTTQTAIATYTASSSLGIEITVIATDTVATERTITKLLVTHDGTTAVATQYGEVNTATAMASYDVDISGGNVRLLATAASTNSTNFTAVATILA